MTEVRDAIRTGKTTVLVFNGSIEQTGPHVVLGKHIFKARYIGERIARELGNALVAPVMPFAPTGAELDKFPGTIDLSAETFSKVNEEVTASLVRSGFKYVILMGDHGGNQEPLKKLAPKLDEKYRPQGVRVFFSGDEYAKADAEVERISKRTTSRRATTAASPTRPRSGRSARGTSGPTRSRWATRSIAARTATVASGRAASKAIRGPRRRRSGRMFDDIKVKDGVAEIRRLIAGAQ